MSAFLGNHGHVTVGGKGAVICLDAGTPEAPARLGRYDVIGRLGKGGMGTVYSAVDRDRGTKLALKTLNAEGPAAILSLKREFRLVADLVHPNLAPVFELTSDHGIWFFSMELIKGIHLLRWARGHSESELSTRELPLSRHLAQMTRTTVVDSGPSPDADTRPEYGLSASFAEPGEASAPFRDVGEVRGAFAQLASGIAALHDAGLRHGDVKPSNALVREDGRVVLVDFGLASNVAEQGAQISKGGTPAYMPPEQMAAREIGPDADWYSFGATLYHVLTGWTPFVADSRLNLYMKKQHEAPLAPNSLDASIPEDLSELCVALLRPDPSQRPSTESILRVLGGSELESAHSEASPKLNRGQSLFVGREEELCRLEQAYGTTRGGQLTLVHAHGPSGIGKSALLDNFLKAVQDVDSALVLRGRCYERESLPYKGFDRIIDSLAEHLSALPADDVRALLPQWTDEMARIFPALGSVSVISERCTAEPLGLEAMELRRRAWTALCSLLKALQQHSPMVLTIDDLQWADLETAQLLDELLRRAHHGRLMVVVLCRPTEAKKNPALKGYFERCEALKDAGLLVELPIKALPRVESERLARAFLNASGAEPTHQLVHSLAHEANGVPFFIEELAYFVAEQGRSGKTLDPIGRGLSLHDAIVARVTLLPEEQRRLLELLAVANSPLPQSIAFEAAGLEAGALTSLLALQNSHLAHWLSGDRDDSVSVYHDRIRESVEAMLRTDARQALHLRLGRSLTTRYHAGNSSLLFDAVRHLGAAAEALTDPDERRAAAELHLKAGRKARDTAAFPLALNCFSAGLQLLPPGAWQTDYDLALSLQAGAVEASYLSADWASLDLRTSQLKHSARSTLDQLVAWETQIDAYAGRHEYDAAIDCAVEALELLGVKLTSAPSLEEVGEAVQATLNRLTELGPDALRKRAELGDPITAAATRIQVRLSPVAYFGRPILLPLIACNLVTSSIERGVSTATPYALALFGIVLNSIGQYSVSHSWGQVALELLERLPDPRLETATRHILNNLVCCWMVPLSSVLDDLRAVFDLGKRRGDYEYASYAAHGYVHNAIYAARPLKPLLTEALFLGQEMRSLGEVNAAHVHLPFEQLLKSLTGNKQQPWTLDDDSFSEQQHLEAAESAGSRSGVFVMKYLPGLVRFYFGRFSEAHTYFEQAHAYLDAVPSIWHLPILQHLGAIAACSILETEQNEVIRRSTRAAIDRDLKSLEGFAQLMPDNFAHRATMVRAELLRVEGRHAEAIAQFDEAIKQAQRGSWVNDIALANELASRCYEPSSEVQRRLRAARTGYAAWGASAKAEQVSAHIAALG